MGQLGMDLEHALDLESWGQLLELAGSRLDRTSASVADKGTFGVASSTSSAAVGSLILVSL